MSLEFITYPLKLLCISLNIQLSQKPHQKAVQRATIKIKRDLTHNFEFTKI